jgi:hypothetical protein
MRVLPVALAFNLLGACAALPMANHDVFMKLWVHAAAVLGLFLSEQLVYKLFSNKIVSQYEVGRGLTMHQNGVGKFYNSNFDEEGAKRRDRYGFGLQCSERLAQAGEIRRVGEDGKAGIPAKFGRAVKHARLSAQEQGADAMRSHRRKDFAYRVRNQVNLPARDKSATVSRFPASVAPVCADTTLPIRRQPVLPAESW